MKMQFQLVFKQGTKTIAVIMGRNDVANTQNLTVEDVREKVIATEQFLEKLTGLRCHIEQVN